MLQLLKFAWFDNCDNNPTSDQRWHNYQRSDQRWHKLAFRHNLVKCAKINLKCLDTVPCARSFLHLHLDCCPSHIQIFLFLQFLTFQRIIMAVISWTNNCTPIENNKLFLPEAAYGATFIVPRTFTAITFSHMCHRYMVHPFIFLHTHVRT